MNSRCSLKFSHTIQSASYPRVCSPVCVCEVGTLPLLTQVCCGHLISQQPRPLGDRCCCLVLVQQSALNAPTHLRYQAESGEHIISILTQRVDHKELLKQIQRPCFEGWCVVPPLWSRTQYRPLNGLAWRFVHAVMVPWGWFKCHFLKYLHNYWVDCRGMWCRYSCSLQDEL